MAKQDYLPRTDASLAAQLEQFATSIGSYAPTLGVSSADVTTQAADAAYFRHTLQRQQLAAQHGQQWTVWKSAIRDGGDGTVASAPAALAAPNGDSPAPVTPGIVPRFRAIVRRVKAAPNYTPAIGAALGIEGADAPAPDVAGAQPVLRVAFTGGRVHVDWTKGDFDGVEIWTDRGDGKGFAFLAVDTVPDYVDTAVLPATAATWKYKAIYRLADEQVGQWSAVVSIAVGG